MKNNEKKNKHMTLDDRIEIQECLSSCRMVSRQSGAQHHLRLSQQKRQPLCTIK